MCSMGMQLGEQLGLVEEFKKTIVTFVSAARHMSSGLLWEGRSEGNSR